MNKLTKIILSVLAFIVTLLPSGFFFAVKSLLNPTGFWEKFIVYGVGIYTLGGLQIVFIILFVTVLVYIWE